MGNFGSFHEQNPSPETECKPFGPNVLEIAKLISSGDEAVLKDVTACTEDPAAHFADLQRLAGEIGHRIDAAERM